MSAVSARRAVTVLAAVAIAAVAACGIPEQGSPTFRGPEEIPFGLADPATTTTAPAVVPGTGASPLCFVDDGAIVRRATFAAHDTLLDRLRAISSAIDADAGVTTALPDAEIVVDAALERGIAEVDLHPDVRELSPTTQRLAFAQLVCTATGAPGVGQVRFTVAGSSVPVPTGDGSLTEELLTTEDYAELLDGRD